ncbi:MAG: hypothetical protein D6733_00260 [Methanobacteriota archaeon]|nr:MAG: hypothetical protein D6733_00260 [Euryarchaeota archaeon]
MFHAHNIIPLCSTKFSWYSWHIYNYRRPCYSDWVPKLKFLGSAKISSKNMITIPKAAREKLRLKAGEFALFYERDDEIIVRKG